MRCLQANGNGKTQNRERGGSIAFLAISLVPLLLVVGLAVDIALIMRERAQSENTLEFGTYLLLREGAPYPATWTHNSKTADVTPGCWSTVSLTFTITSPCSGGQHQALRLTLNGNNRVSVAAIFSIFAGFEKFDIASSATGYVESGVIRMARNSS